LAGGSPVRNKYVHFTAGYHNTKCDIRNYEGKIQMNNVWILAQTGGNEEPSTITSEPVTAEDTTTTTTVPTDPNSTGGRSGGRGPLGPLGSYGNLIFLGLMFVLMYMILFRGPRKKQQQHRQMVQTLAKNDKVRTIGGIIGTVVDIKGDEVTLKVDESNNTKIKVIASAIGKNVSKDKS
jgi:preprotein translocase subunit YajC